MHHDYTRKQSGGVALPTVAAFATIILLAAALGNWVGDRDDAVNATAPAEPTAAKPVPQPSPAPAVEPQPGTNPATTPPAKPKPAP